MVTVREALRQALEEELERDPNVFLMGEEVDKYQGAYKISKGLGERFGSGRIVDTPISEYGFSGLAVGAAYAGLRPVVEFMSFNFSMQAIDHIINSAAKTLYMSGGQVKCPIVFRGPNGIAAGVGAQHSQCYASWYSHCPGLKVIAPYDSQSAKGLLKAAIRDDNPVVFLEHELLYGESFPLEASSNPWPIGKAKIRKEGQDVTIVCFSLMVKVCLQAAEILSKLGISAEVLDLCTLRPLDIESLRNSIQKTHRCLVVEEGWPVCGIGSEIIALSIELAFDFLDAPAMRLSGKDIPLPYAKNLESLCFPHVQDVVDSVKHLCKGMR
ncbi:pyruvate dehydrogenase E1 component subunit beta-2, mitochondrial [Holospora elegans E1]|uniref:Pyruvate dehydrogenase E1 component subunit beta n=1 Tax=Holospora elegans E1 TaxID=1427503 RepID=A0A023DYC2_9PROT|nr:pyruvate dehydrogenase complex E1 component subunit beta [Holospora elegans]GAJ45925.1 pyruvate dehydrogenase E1 component subunit beta-2, mitochondrial [Holospora elegans E1]